MKEDYIASAECFCKIDDFVCFPVRETNYLFLLDTDQMQFYTIESLPNEHFNLTRLYGGICSFNNNIMLAPYNAEKIWIYDRNDKNWFSVNIESYVSPDSIGKFMGCTLIKDKIYLFGYKYKGVLTLDTKKFEVKEVLKSKSNFWGKCVAVSGDYLYVADNQENTIYKINTLDDTTEKIIPKYENDGFAGLMYHNDYIYILPRTGNNFIKWDMKNEYESLMIDTCFNDGKNHFNGLVVSDNSVLLYSPADKSYLYNLIDNTGIILNRKIKYANLLNKKELIIFEEGKIYITNDKMENLRAIDLTVSNDVVREQAKQYKFNKGYIPYESNFFALSDFLCSVCSEVRQ